MRTITILFLISVILSGCNNNEPEVFLFSYFVDNGEDGLHLAWSEDGYTFEALNGNASFLTPEVGYDKLMRDPCIIKGPDGEFHMVWTVSWNERGIGYAHSEDLLNWSAQEFIPVMVQEPEAVNCWAPELFYDEEREEYLIFWSTTIPGRFPETDSSGSPGRNHRIYYTTTKDFVDFSQTELFFNQGFNVIDATIERNNDEYLMFVKNESLNPELEKNIRMTTSESLYSGWAPVSEPLTGSYTEGPTAVQTADGWILYFDRYREGRMGALRSGDLEKWTDISDSIQFPEGTRHGSVLKVNRSLVDNLKGQ